MKQEIIPFAIPSHMPGYGGWGNGYVAIPKDHPAFGKDYNDEIFDSVYIHGGLTYSEEYSEKYNPIETEGMWIIGFDTLHLGDDMNRWPTEESVMNEANNLKAQIEAIL